MCLDHTLVIMHEDCSRLKQNIYIIMLHLNFYPWTIIESIGDSSLLLPLMDQVAICRVELPDPYMNVWATYLGEDLELV